MKRMLFNYHEVAEILGLSGYNAVRMAVRNQKIRAVSTPGERKRLVPREEIERILSEMGECEVQTKIEVVTKRCHLALVQ